jgi:hypothetical protein
MSEPLPPTPAPSPAPVKIDWQAWGRALVVILSVVGALFAKLPAPTPEPSPAVIVHPPAAEPEQWILLDSEGFRTTDAAVEKIADTLKPGKWTAQGIPKPGERGVSLTITVDDGVVVVPPKPPGPPPVVDPPKPPEPPPSPAPITDGGLRVLIVYDENAKQSMTRDQLNALASPALLGYLDQHCIKVNGRPEYYIVDKNEKFEGQPIWQKAMALPRPLLPWLIVSNGKSGESLPLNKDTEALATIQKYAQ